MRRQQHTKALYYTNDTIEEVLIGPRKDASHITTPHPHANGNLQTLTFKLRYTNSFNKPHDESPLTRYQPTPVIGSDKMHFSESVPDEILAVVTERGEIFRNKLVSDQDIDYEQLRTHAKQYFSNNQARDEVA